MLYCRAISSWFVFLWLDTVQMVSPAYREHGNDEMDTWDIWIAIELHLHTTVLMENPASLCPDSYPKTPPPQSALFPMEGSCWMPLVSLLLLAL